MPGWAIFQSATLGQFCIGANSSACDLAGREREFDDWSGRAEATLLKLFPQPREDCFPNRLFREQLEPLGSFCAVSEGAEHDAARVQVGLALDHKDFVDRSFVSDQEFPAGRRRQAYVELVLLGKFYFETRVDPVAFRPEDGRDQ